MNPIKSLLTTIGLLFALPIVWLFNRNSNEPEVASEKDSKGEL
jgi:hypothetical protein